METNFMQTPTAVLVAMMFWPSFAALGASNTGTISGTVVDQSGAPIIGARILYRTVQPNRQSSPPGAYVSSSALSAGDGAFTITNLPPATYTFCAYGKQSSDLGSCEWGQGPTRVTLASGDNAQLKFVVAQGSLLTFVVADPRQQIKSLEDLPAIGGRLPLFGANFVIGVWAGPMYTRASLASKNGVVRQYQVAIPKMSAVRLFVDTSLNVIDANGVPIVLHRLGQTIFAAGQSQVTINLTVP